MVKKRSRLDIVSDMLATIQKKGGEIKPTHLMYGANLAHTQMKQYMKGLYAKELIKDIKKKKGGNLIALTDNGYKYLQKLNEMREFEEAFGI